MKFKPITLDQKPPPCERKVSMPSDVLSLLTILGLLCCGLMAGVFFAFSSFVMPGLSRLPPAQGIAAMQSINVAALRPPFLAAFLGAAAACLLLAGVSVWSWHAPGAPYRFAGSVLYLVGTFGVTAAFNVPRNEALAAVSTDGADSAARWARFLAGWTAWNHVRAVAALAATALLGVALR